MIFGIWLKILPITANWPAGAKRFSPRSTICCCRRCRWCWCCSDISRAWRAPGTIEALAADYTRTAVLKGLKPRAVLWRHVLRNALLPTITVTATQLGYLMGGLVVVETLFRYPGIGGLIYAAARDRDFPMLEGGVLTVGIIYIAGGSDCGHHPCAAQSAHSIQRGLNEGTLARPAALRHVHDRRPDRGVLDAVRAVRPPHRAVRPVRRRYSEHPGCALPLRTGSAPTSSGATCSRESSSARATS